MLWIYMNIMYVYCHMNGPVIGLFEMKDRNSVQTLIDRSNAIYRLCLHSIHTKAPNHPIYQTNFVYFQQ